MPDVQLTDVERKVLSYCSRGVSKELAVEKISAFLNMTPNDVAGALGSLKRQGLVIESKNISSAFPVYTTHPLKVKSSMLDPAIIDQLTNRERGTKAGALKKTVFDSRTGEIREVDPNKKERPKADFGFDVE